MNAPESVEARLFEAALEYPTPAERAAYLDQACAGQPEVRRRVEALLAGHEQAGEFMDAAAAERPTLALDLVPQEKPGSMIGRYKLLQKIGEGGMGVVYLAEQTAPVIRKVALKIIKLGMDTRAVVARFEAERQALALMDHPNIAKVLDAGATESVHGVPSRRLRDGSDRPKPGLQTVPAGRPYFVMELVHGVPITEYCDKNRLTTRERLELFIPVCQAIQHAHQKGIIHRDIKPSNVMVTLHDGMPVPKVIDFGVAKATNQRLTEKTLFTNYAQMIGTPAYMSPEQAEMSGLDIDTRSDVYSLGVLLYELLAGSTPFDAKELLSKGYAEMQRIIVEREPMKPSNRMSTLTDEQRTVVAKNRNVEESALRKVLQGDLDWILMKCLEKDRTRRYETASALAVELRRHLSNEPVMARPPSRWYRLQKGVRRNRLACTVGTALALVLVVATLISSWQAIRATRAEALAAERLVESQAITKFLTEDLLLQATPDQTARERAITMEQVLDIAAKRLDAPGATSRHPPKVEATIRRAIGSTYVKLGLYNQAEPLLRAAVEIRRRELGREHLETLLVQQELATLLLGFMNRFDEEAERLSRETWQSLHQLLDMPGSKRGDTSLYRAMLDGESQYIWALANRGELARAVELKRRNTASYEELFGPDDIDTINELHNLAMVLARHGDFVEAGRLGEEALKRYARIGTNSTEGVFAAVAGLAASRFFQGDAPGAEALLVEAIPRASRNLGPESPPTLHLQSYLSRVLAEQGRLSEAETLARSTMLARRRVLGTNEFNTAYTTLILGRILVKRGQFAEATLLLEGARRVFRERFPKLAAFSAEAENWLGAAHLAQGNPAQARELLVPGADELMLPSAFLSPQERRDSIGHVIQFHEGAGNLDLAAGYARRLDELSPRTRVSN